MMNEVISYDPAFIQRNRNSFLVLFAVSLLVATFFRISLLAIYPLIILFLVVYYRFRLSLPVILLLALAGFGCILSLYPHLFAKYKILSLYHLLPFILLLFAQPTISRLKNLEAFIKMLSAIVVVNDLIGIVQVIRNPASDDSFLGIYTEFSVSINGLMLLNTLLFFYYFLHLIYKRNLNYLLPSLFFFSCSMMGFYGAGLMISIAAFILSFFSFRLPAIIKTTLISIIALTTVYFVMMAIKPATLEYNLANLKKITSLDTENGPRKIRAFYNYVISYPTNAKDFLFGSGPGTFNSRSAFMVGSPTYFSRVDIIKDDEQPYYFKNYAYSLWNPSNNSKALYQDGFRNQPFSSILSFLGEYGFIFTVAFFVFYYQYYRSVVKLYHAHAGNSGREIPFRFFKFLMVLLPLLLLIDNYMEYPEIIIPLLLSIKFAHQALISMKPKSADGI